MKSSGLPFLFCPGAVVLIRTVTHYHVGRVVRVHVVGGVGFVELADAAWIADTGRFSGALLNSTFNEVEPFPNGILVGLGSIIDVTAFSGSLPLTQK